MNGPRLDIEDVGSVRVLTLHDPARRNVLSSALRHGLVEACRDLQADQSPRRPRAVVLTGAQGAFSAGGDLSEMPPASRDAARERLQEVRWLVEAIRHSFAVWVAAVEGPAAGVSCGLAAACDVVVAGESAKFLVPFSRLGLVPDGGALWTVAHRVGANRAKRLFLHGDPVSAQEAHSLGLADEVVPDGTALERATSLASELAMRAPGSVTAIKDYYAAGEHTLSSALEFEAERQVVQYFSPELTEGRAAFFERRPPNFTQEDS